MKFHVSCTDGPAQIGTLYGTNTQATIPCLFQIKNTRFPNAFSQESPQLFFKEPIKDDNNKTDVTPQCFCISLDNTCVSQTLLISKDIPPDTGTLEKKHMNNEANTLQILPAHKAYITDNLTDKNTSIYIISQFQQLLSQPKDCISYISKVRDAIGYDALLYTPGVADPINMAFLTYLGINCFDTLKAMIAARQHIMMFPHALIHTDEIHENPCHCSSCHTHSSLPSDLTIEQIFFHNLYIMDEELKTIRNAIRQQQLRSLAETRITGHPSHCMLFQTYERQGYSYLEERMPLYTKKILQATTREFIFHPMIQRFQDRVLHRFIKPASTTSLLLLPCSAKKPYSFSKSHMLFKKTLSKVKNHLLLHEVILTSPLGLVPRELELFYPASSYDIPVTGTWYEDEQKMIRSMLSKYIEKNKYDMIFVHLPKNITSFITDLLPNAICTVQDDKPTSPISLECLYTTLENNISQRQGIQAKKRFWDHVLAIASYQFGPDIAHSFLENTNIKGKYPYFRIYNKENIQLGMITKERGFLSLTIEGAKRLAHHQKYIVHITDDFKLKGSVFAPAVISADKEIRIGDEVFINQGDKLIGVGVAQMCGNEMIDRRYGEAVKIRHSLS